MSFDLNSSMPPPPPRTPAGGQSMSIEQALQLALQHHQRKEYDNAERIYRQVLSVDATHIDALHLLGLIAHAVNRNDVALDLVGRAVQLAPTAAAFHNTLGEIHRVTGRLDLAFYDYQRALRYQPNLPEALNNLGILYAYRCELDKSVQCFERAIALRPDYPEAHDGLGLTLLLAGELRRGWLEQEWRWKKPILAAARRNFAQPMWDGKPISGKRLLVHAEQGFGDVLQFCRYVPIAKKLVDGPLIFECPPELMGLCKTLGGFDQIVEKGKPLPEFDVQIPVMSLPLVLETDHHNIPADVPYLHADPERVAYWKAELDKLGPGIKVGVAWAGRPTHPRDAGRSTTLSTFKPFSEVPGVKLVSLQKGEGQGQIMSNPGVITAELGSRFNDFADSAALVTALDVVLAVDTSLVHLAGALGKPSWVLMPFSPDWRWQLNRTDSPWYPTMRLFRQKYDTVWTHPVDAACRALAEMVAAKK